jgi:hypothetical protein
MIALNFALEKKSLPVYLDAIRISMQEPIGVYPHANLLAAY